MATIVLVWRKSDTCFIDKLLLSMLYSLYDCTPSTHSGLRLLWFGGYRSSLSSRLLSSGGGGRRGLLGGLGLDLLGLHLEDDLLEALVLNHSILELRLQLYRLHSIPIVYYHQVKRVMECVHTYNVYSIYIHISPR